MSHDLWNNPLSNRSYLSVIDHYQSFEWRQPESNQRIGEIPRQRSRHFTYTIVTVSVPVVLLIYSITYISSRIVDHVNNGSNDTKFERPEKTVSFLETMRN